jgi:hypothetical protein
MLKLSMNWLCIIRVPSKQRNDKVVHRPILTIESMHNL